MRDPVLDALDEYLKPARIGALWREKAEEAVDRVTSAVDKEYANEFLKILDFAKSRGCKEACYLCSELGLTTNHFYAHEDWELEQNHNNHHKMVKEMLHDCY